MRASGFAFCRRLRRQRRDSDQPLTDAFSNSPTPLELYFRLFLFTRMHRRKATISVVSRSNPGESTPASARQPNRGNEDAPHTLIPRFRAIVTTLIDSSARPA